MNAQRLREMTETLSKMQQLKAEVVSNDSKRELEDMRYNALVEIQGYLKNLADAVKGTKLCFENTNISIYYLNRIGGTGNRQLEITICNGDVSFYESSFGSSLTISNFCKLTKEDMFEKNDLYRIGSEYKSILTNWGKIKSFLGTEVEKELLRQMANTQQEVETFKNTYEKAMDFTV